MLRLIMVLLLISFSTGCTEQESDSASSADNFAGKSSGVKIEQPVAEPVPFEKIPLSTDSSYESAPASEGASPGEVREFTNLKIKFCWCPPGTFRIGSDELEVTHKFNEAPVDVTLSKGFWMQQTEVTQQQFSALMGVNPSFHKGDQHPVDSVNWLEAREFCRRLSELPPEKKTGNNFRLPTEYEWEYACRAGTTTIFSFGSDETGMEDYAWFTKNSLRTTHPVAEKKPNPWGLFDMHGNVSEWCEDFYGDYPSEPVTDPRGPESGEMRTLRGGGWFYVGENARSCHRDAYAPKTRYIGLGFRIVLTNTPPQTTPAQ